MVATRIIFGTLILLLLPSPASAASLYLNPTNGTYPVSSVFTTTVYADSAGETVNGFSGTVSFPTALLEVVSVSKLGSVITFWGEEPTFSNTSGTVAFEGVALNPGYSGNSGRLLTITFRTKTIGQAPLSFSSGSILADDGMGTNVLTDFRNAVVTIDTGAASASTPVQAATSIITSSTHPDQSKWYSNNAPEFSWKLPSDALEVRTSIGRSPTGIPTVRYSPPITKKKVEGLSEGTFYFNVQVRTAAGWSEVSRYRINIDTIAPEPFSIVFPHGDKSLEPQPVILFNTEDRGSGIDHYDIKVGNGTLLRSAPIALSNPYALPPQTPGSHTVSVVAIDRAGNTTTTETDFEIEGIDAPIVTYYTEQLKVGDIMKVRGVTYPNADIKLFIRTEEELVTEDSTKANGTGNFSLVVGKRLSAGEYTFTLQTIDGRGAMSAQTDPLPVTVQANFLTDFVSFVLDYLSLVILGILALGGIIAGLIFLWSRLSRKLNRVRHRNKEASAALEDSFTELRRSIKTHIARLKKAEKKRELTTDEIAFLEQFSEELQDAKTTIAKKISNITPK